jgi:threonyl-tRNA synthetase
VLRTVAEGEGLDLVMDEGGGAFYGPKISVQAKDAIGRTWQMSTIQLDFNTPVRFGLTYDASDGTRQTPVMIHRALFGSVERFFGVLVEHYAGAFPAWLAPVQVSVLPVGADHLEYAQSVYKQLKQAGFRVELSATDEKLGSRIRREKLQKLPYILVVGADDAAAGTVGVNKRGSDAAERGVAIADFIARLRDEVDTHS